MALSNNATFNSEPLIFLSPRAKDAKGVKVPPHFEIARVQEDKSIKKTGETCTKVSGDLKRPRFYERDFKGTPIKHVTLYIRDNTANETYSLDLTYRISSRQIFNGLLMLADPKNVSISIYENKKGYEALSLWQADKMVPWKFDGRKGEIPEPTTTIFKGKELHDFSPVDDFFEAEMKAWAEKLFGPEKAKDAKPATGTTTSANVATTNSVNTTTPKESAPAAADTDEVPF